MPPAAPPLSGVVVVSVEQAVAVPFASRQLGDLGAMVIKIERPEGDFARGYDRAAGGRSAHFAWLNAGKRSVRCDLHCQQDRDLLERLTKHADVFLHNLAPGALDRLGLPVARLSAANPRLVAVGVSGYGEGGPYTGRKAYDTLLQAESGLLAVTGTPQAPCRAGISVADIAAGMYALTSVLAGLYQRECTGTGSVTEISMLDAMAEWMGQPLSLAASTGGEGPQRTGAAHPTIAPYGPFTASDGQTVFLAVQNDREWTVLAREVLSRPEAARAERFATNSDRVAHRGELDALVAAGVAELSSQELVRRLVQHNLAYGRQRSVREVLDHPQLAARERWRVADFAGVPVRLPRPAVQAGPAGVGPVSVPAEPGADTASVLAWLVAAEASGATERDSGG